MGGLIDDNDNTWHLAGTTKMTKKTKKYGGIHASTIINHHSGREMSINPIDFDGNVLRLLDGFGQWPGIQSYKVVPLILS